MKLKKDYVLSVTGLLLIFLVFIITLADICLILCTGLTISELIGFDTRLLRAGLLVLSAGLIIWAFIIFEKGEGANEK